MTWRGTLVLGALLLVPALRAPEIDMIQYRMNRFAEHYNTFALGLRDGVFDLRAAKRLSQLWRDLEGTEGWPKPDGR